MSDIKKKINYLYQHLFNMKIHPFFSDMYSVEKNALDFHEYQKSTFVKKISYKKTNIPESIKKEIVYNTISDETLKDFYKETKNSDNLKKILKIVSQISTYYLKTNISNEKMLLDKIEKEDKLNILIIGAGPIGLYLAIYLNIYYNTSNGFNYKPKVNVVVYDNRIYKPGFRQPYNRHRVFSTSSKFLSVALTKIYSMYKSEFVTINIYVLEYLLYVKALYDYNIPIIYEDYDWNDYKKIIDQGNFKVVFDCTGGRLNTDVFDNPDDTWLKNLILVDEKLNKKLKIIRKKNRVHLIDINEEPFKKNFYYSSLNIYKDDEYLTYLTKFDIDIANNHDLKLINGIKKNKYSLNSIKKIIHNIKDDTSRNYLYNLNIFNDEKYEKYIYDFDVWAVYIRHIIQPSEVFTVNNKEILYINAGDSVFHSHFTIGSGLNRTLNFAVKCANYLIDLK